MLCPRVLTWSAHKLELVISRSRVELGCGVSLCSSCSRQKPVGVFYHSDLLKRQDLLSQKGACRITLELCSFEYLVLWTWFTHQMKTNTQLHIFRIPSDFPHWAHNLPSFHSTSCPSLSCICKSGASSKQKGDLQLYRNRLLFIQSSIENLNPTSHHPARLASSAC